MTYLIRLARPADKNFILSSYLRSNRRRYPDVSNPVYYEGATAHLMLLAEQHDIYVITDSEDAEQTQILGWLLGSTEDNCVHYLYIKQLFRHMGLARQLLDFVCTPTETLTFTQHPGAELLNKLKQSYPRVEYNPFPRSNPYENQQTNLGTCNQRRQAP